MQTFSYPFIVTDMFNPTDLKDPDKAQRINLTIEDFDAVRYKLHYFTSSYLNNVIVLNYIP